MVHIIRRFAPDCALSKSYGLVLRCDQWLSAILRWSPEPRLVGHHHGVTPADDTVVPQPRSIDRLLPRLHCPLALSVGFSIRFHEFDIWQEALRGSQLVIPIATLHDRRRPRLAVAV